MKPVLLTLLLLCLAWFGCQLAPPPPATPWGKVLQHAPALSGRSEYRASPYVTAGNRLYAVGHQDGRFPALGWHVPGEMGGIWDHPIKLFDGFVFIGFGVGLTNPKKNFGFATAIIITNMVTKIVR